MAEANSRGRRDEDAPCDRTGSRGELDRSRRHAAKLRAAGLCATCRAPHDRGTRRCADCTKKAVATNVRSRREARVSGRCVACGQPWQGETKRCPACKAAQRARWGGRAGTDYCTRCAGPRDGRHKSCSACRAVMREQNNRRRQAFAAAGRCIQCGEPKSGPSLYCDRHILMAAARRYLGAAVRWRDLRDLLASQGSRCVYSGEALALGGNASIDHKFPSSRGGPDEIDNLQWVTWTVNQVKKDLTHEEFIALCRKVASRFPG
jgi:hypothetical protein